MARKTKEEAAATRDRILDAAEQLFSEQGVSRTTLQHIATAAGVTRGAIYWHFDDKGALFDAMMERAVMPLESAMALLDQSDCAEPLRDLREYTLAALRVTVQDPHARRVFEIASLKVEFIEELDVARMRRQKNLDAWMTRTEGRIRLAAERGEVRPGVNPRVAAFGMWTLIHGLIRDWLFNPAAFDLIELGAEVIDTYLAGIRA